jgi:excisionase family DNA binding protein
VASAEIKNSEVQMFPLVHTIPEACSGAKTGRTTLYKAIQEGKLRAVKCGKRTLILDEDLREFVRSWPQLEPAKRDDPPSVPKPAQPFEAATKARNRTAGKEPPRRPLPSDGSADWG